MKRTLVALAALALPLSGLLAAAPASAYDPDAFAYAAGHMVQSSDIPPALGRFGHRLSFNGMQGGRGSLILCDIQDASYQVPGGKFSFEATFTEKGDSPTFLTEQVHQYSNAEAAIAAFGDLKAKIVNCTGTQTTVAPADSSGATNSWTTATSNGVVPMVTETGVESVFVNIDSTFTSPAIGLPDVNDSYSVFSLVDDVIIRTGYTTDLADNVTTRERKKVAKVAFAAIGRWVE